MEILLAAVVSASVAAIVVVLAQRTRGHAATVPPGAHAPDRPPVGPSRRASRSRAPRRSPMRTT